MPSTYPDQRQPQNISHNRTAPDREAPSPICSLYAREIADVTVEGNDLYELVALKHISNALMKRIHKNYRMIMGINSTLIVLGVAGIIPPTTSALLHNTSTIAISLKSLEKLI